MIHAHAVPARNISSAAVSKMDYSIIFPNLHITLSHVGKEISIGSFTIAFYGITIAIGMLAGLGVALWQARRTKQNTDQYFDFVIIAIILSVLGARIYYEAFRWEYYKDNLKNILNIRQGGLAIYGGIIVAVITAIVWCKVKKIKMGLFVDTAVLGLITGQIIGRWGNFFNREAFGDYCDGPFAMLLPLNAVRSSDVTDTLYNNLVQVDGVTYISVHPTFLYESLWNLALLILLILYTKHKKFDGEILLLYLVGYGVGRFWIENLRTDQLLIPGLNYPVSRALSAVVAVAAAAIIAVIRTRLWKKSKNQPIEESPSEEKSEEDKIIEEILAEEEASEKK